MSKVYKGVFGSKKLKKGQADASAAATLVAVLALLIILYLLFIPPDVRDEILEGNGTTTDRGDELSSNETYLKEAPGTLAPLDAEDVEHTVPSVNLFATESAKTLGQSSPLSVKSSLFTHKTADMHFEVTDLENTENVLITFLAKKAKGILHVTVNGNDVFNSEVLAENVEPIRVPRRFLNEGDNVVAFEMAEVGFAFWRVNRATIDGMRVTADVTDVSQQRARNIFIVSSTEANNVQRSVLRFVPDCSLSNVGKLDISINGHSVFYAIPDCGSPHAIEFAPEVLRLGENRIIFTTDKGNYLIDLIRIESELKEVLQPVYYFELEEDVLDDLRDGDYDILLRIEFLDDDELKSGKLNINGRETNIYQDEKIYEKNLNDYVREGNNAIKILPDETMDILTLEVVRD